MLFPGNLSNTTHANLAITDTTRARLSNLGIILAVAEVATENTLNLHQTPLQARVLSVAPTAANNTEQHRVQIEVNGQTLWVRMLQKPVPGEQLQIQLTDQKTLQNASTLLSAKVITIDESAAQSPSSSKTDATLTATRLSADPASTAPKTSATSTFVNTNQSNAQVSPFGNLVNQLLSRIEQHTSPPPQLPSLAPHIETTQSLLPEHLPTQQIATGVHEAIEKSGLFYESHLGSWVRNERTTEQIRQEPQASAHIDDKLSNTPHASSPKTAASDQLTNIASKTEYAPPEKLLPILREQMQVLEQRQFTAQIEIWPHQMAQLTIAEEGQHSNSPTPDDPMQWSAKLKLHLPQLGNMDATLQIVGQEVHLNIVATEHQSVQKLQHHALDLQQALQASGLQLSQFKVQHE